MGPHHPSSTFSQRDTHRQSAGFSDLHGVSLYKKNSAKKDVLSNLTDQEREI